MQVELNEGFAKGLHLLEHGKGSLFVTGKAGTGKSTLLDYFRSLTQKKLVVVAPTGVAALNVQGETIHSLFRFHPGITVSEAEDLGKSFSGSLLFREMELLVIDEVSMVRADLLDAVDLFLRGARGRRKPFGELRLAFIGDLYQLPPVVVSQEKEALAQAYRSPYFFDALVMEELSSASLDRQLEFLELEKIYRQHDVKFIELLNGIRNRTITEEQLSRLNGRVREDLSGLDGDFIYLTTTNQDADRRNLENLEKLSSRLFRFSGIVKGEFDPKHFPTDIELCLKKGARVMLLNNDTYGRWVNGTLGTVSKIHSDVVKVRLDSGETVDIEPFTWSAYRSEYDARSRSIEKEVVGIYTQLPLRLAWAVTIHKSQGKTFDRVLVDLGRGAFSHGQVYVALSRCRTFEGLILKRAVRKKEILMDYRVIRFLTRFQYRLSEERIPLGDKVKRLEQAVARKEKLHITYLKSKDEKSRRTILPLRVADMEYEGVEFVGVEAYCFLRNDRRTFNVERILEIAEEG